MLFHVSSHLEYAVKFPSTLIINIHAEGNTEQTIIEESFKVTPDVKNEEFRHDSGGNCYVRLATGDAKTLSIDYAATDNDNWIGVRLVEMKKNQSLPSNVHSSGPVKWFWRWVHTSARHIAAH